MGEGGWGDQFVGKRICRSFIVKLIAFHIREKLVIETIMHVWLEREKVLHVTDILRDNFYMVS